MLTARQKTLIASSWELMRPMANHVADLFYDRLFELDPLLEDVFPEDGDIQRLRFTKAMGAALNALDDVDGLRPALQDLGRRQQSHGIEPGHYATLGNALLWTFEQTLAQDFTPPVKEAWAALYAQLSVAGLQGTEPRDAYKLRERTQLAL